MEKKISHKSGISGNLTVPGDKSISHRAVMFGAIAKGDTKINGFLNGADCLSTISCFREMGIEIEIDSNSVTVHGNGLHGLKAPQNILDVGNSGTTMRLLSGLLSGQNFTSQITGDSSIQSRPMDRVCTPLKQMGAKIYGNASGCKVFAPLKICGAPLNGICYTLPVASAQVKSAILLASLYSKGKTEIIEPIPTRDHSEIMLNHFGADISREHEKIISRPVEELHSREIYVPGDISSAAYFIVAATICKGSEITIKNVGVNPTRTGVITVLKNMGANISISNEKTVCGEYVADIHVKHSKLRGTTIGGKIIPTLIDEIPVLAVAAAFAKGKTIIKDARELKVKESNRIKTVVCELKKFGANIEETDDGMVIIGKENLSGARCESHNDHRIAMSMAVAALAAEGASIIENKECVDISFPEFFDYIERL